MIQRLQLQVGHKLSVDVNTVAASNSLIMHNLIMHSRIELVLTDAHGFESPPCLEILNLFFSFNEVVHGHVTTNIG